MEDKQYKDIEIATIYKVRRTFLNSGKQNFTAEEVGEFLDKIAMANEQEK